MVHGKMPIHFYGLYAGTLQFDNQPLMAPSSVADRDFGLSLGTLVTSGFEYSVAVNDEIHHKNLTSFVH